MNNTTMKRFDITIKLRGDNVYDLYVDKQWIASRGHIDNILDEARNAIREKLLSEGSQRKTEDAEDDEDDS